MDRITHLKPNQVFVFGSNLAGRHGRGAARQALKWGAKYGQGIGLMGRTYGIPTKDRRLNVLPISNIEKHVQKFIEFAKSRPDLEFLVTPIGCGLAGYSPKQIAPLFKDAVSISNIKLPKVFLKFLKEEL